MIVDSAKIQIEQIAAASVPNPPTGRFYWFVDSVTGHTFQKDSAGNVIDLTTTGSSGSSSTKGTVVINFGSFPGSNEASIAVTGQSGILATSECEAFVSASASTSDHTSNDHTYFAMLTSLTCSVPTAGIGFAIQARSAQKLQGTFTLNWNWS